MAQQILSTNTFTTAKWIVSATASQGTHTTIASAISSASAGDTIFIFPGTYTENLTLKVGVNIVADVGDSNEPNVTIVGKCTFTGAGTASISNINLQTNSDYFLVVSGSSASVVYLNNCFLNCSNNTGIDFTSSSSSSEISINYCSGNVATTGIGVFTSSSAGVLGFDYCTFSNSGGSTTASTISAGTLFIYYCQFSNPITSSSTSAFLFNNSTLNTGGNTTCLTFGGSGSQAINHSTLFSGTASAISVGGTLSCYNSIIVSSNAAAITGGGAVDYGHNSFPSLTAGTINTTTQIGGVAQGLSTGQAPSAGYIGEHFNNTSNASVSNNMLTDLTSIALTAGVWDITGLGNYTWTGANTYAQLGVSATPTTLAGTQGDQWVQYLSGSVSSAANAVLSIPSFRVTLTSTTPYYLVVLADFSTGSCTVFGRISATRVG